MIRLHFFRASLWRQLLATWVGAILVAALLMWIAAAVTKPQKFFYLFPYPSGVWSAIKMTGQAFRAEPLFATALIGVPLLALLTTAALLGARLMRAR